MIQWKFSSLANASVNALYEEMLIVPEDHTQRAQKPGDFKLGKFFT
jgi:hypothetical protein